MSINLEPREITIASSDGVTLEAQYISPSVADAPLGAAPSGDASTNRDALARTAVLLCHPHPLQGGNMKSLVTSELFRLLPPQGVSCLRFNFRGVGKSTGEHDFGRGESSDVTHAFARLVEMTPHAAVRIVVGWSFGGDVSLSTPLNAVDGHRGSDGWIAIAPPLRFGTEPAVAARSGKPVLIILAEHDQVRPAQEVAEDVTNWPNTTVEVVGGADHFFAGRTKEVAGLVTARLISLADIATS